MSESDAKYDLKLSGDGVALDLKVDREVALEVIELALGGKDPAGSKRTDEVQTRGRDKPRGKSRTRTGRKKGGTRKPRTPGIVRDVSLRPKGKPSLTDFAAEKQPTNHLERQVVAVYYLARILEVRPITIDHVNTCYREADWRRPANLENSLQVTASRAGWLETSDMDDIKLPTRGEDFVEHELPHDS